MIYQDDILIYSEDEILHDHHVWEVLSRLQEKHLFAKLEKCVFDLKQLDLLGYGISTDGIQMDHRKLHTVLSWQDPCNTKDVQSLLGFVNFHRKFIPSFEHKVKPLTQLLKGDWNLLWRERSRRHLKSWNSFLLNSPFFNTPTQPIQQIYCPDWLLWCSYRYSTLAGGCWGRRPSFALCILLQSTDFPRKKQWHF